MNTIRSCKNGDWQQRFFIYKLLDDSRFTLEYWQSFANPEEKRVYCRELYESIGEGPDDFNYNFHFGKFQNEIRACNTGNRSLMCSLKDALSYAIDRFSAFRNAFKECGLNALESKEEGDLLGIIANTAQVSKEEASVAVLNIGVVQSVQTLLPACKTEDQLNAVKDICDNMTSAFDSLIKERARALKAEEEKKRLGVELNNQKGLQVERTLIKEVISEYPALKSIKAPFNVFREWCYNNKIYNKGCYTVLQSSNYWATFYFDGENKLCAFPHKREEAKQIIKDVLFHCGFKYFGKLF